MMTLKELKQSVPESKRIKTMPSAKALRESQVSIAVYEQLSMDSAVWVYGNGLVLYERGKYTTVFRLHKCKDYYYERGLESEFDSLPYYILLMLEGEQRLEHNQEMRENNWNLHYSKLAEDCGILAEAAVPDPLEMILMGEEAEEILSAMTERQSMVVRMFYLEEKRQDEIAELLGIRRATVAALLRKALEKARRHFI